MKYQYEVVHERLEVGDNNPDHYRENKILEGNRGEIEDAEGSVVALAVIERFKKLGNIVKLHVEQLP